MTRRFGTYPDSRYDPHIGKVLVLAVVDNSVQSHDTDNRDQKTNAKHEHDEQLLGCVEIHLPKLIYWQAEHEEVKNDINHSPAG